MLMCWGHEGRCLRLLNGDAPAVAAVFSTVKRCCWRGSMDAVGRPV